MLVGLGAVLGGGGRSQIIGPQQPDAVVPPYKTIRLRMAFLFERGKRPLSTLKFC